MTMDQFIDLCILCGSDYTQTIQGIGPVRAFSLIKEAKSIEGVLEILAKKNANPKTKRKFIVPDEFPYQEARDIFKSPNVIRDITLIEKSLVWTECQEEKLREFLITEKAFSESRVESGI